MRLAIALGFTALTVALGPLLGIDPPSHTLRMLTVATLLVATSAVALLRLRRGATGTRGLAMGLALLDTALATVVGLEPGGVHGVLPLLYAVVVTVHALRLQVPPLAVAVTASSLAFLALAWRAPSPPTVHDQLLTVGCFAMIGMAAAEAARLGQRLLRLALEQQRQRLETERSVSRYFSPQVRQVLLSRPGELLSSQHREVTALFADLSGFTALGEAAPGIDVIETLDAYLQVLADTAIARDGTVDNYLGDGVLVTFNAPLDQPDHARRAVDTALAMQRAALSLSRERHREGRPALGLTIGINTGPAVAGPVGGDARMQYTVIGDPVNVASRLQAEGRPGDVIVGEGTVRAAGVQGDWERAEVKGRQHPVRFVRLPVDDDDLRPLRVAV